MGNYVKLLRPEQWIKNFLLFAPLFFSFNFSAAKIIQVSFGFILFSLAASGLYVLNDLIDREVDQLHPEKKNRPLASGVIGLNASLILMISAFLVSVTGAAILNHGFLTILLLYIAINIAYSLKLKQISILDISLIAIGFVLRIYAGAEIIDVTPTHWIVLVTFLLALFLTLAKRRDDVLLGSSGLKTRKNIEGYNLEMINAGMVFMAGVTTVAYIMYTLSEEVISRLGSSHIYITSFFVVTGILRYMQITFVEKRSGNPTLIATKDLFLQLVIVAWLLCFLIIYYLL